MAEQLLQLHCARKGLLAAHTTVYREIMMWMQIEELETQMAEMHQSSAALAEVEASLRQQVSGLQVSSSQCPASADF